MDGAPGGESDIGDLADQLPSPTRTVPSTPLNGSRQSESDTIPHWAR